MKIARVFPTKTSMTPTDSDAYFGLPEMFMPKYDEVHISCNFTWDIQKAKWLALQWQHIAPVKIGGVAIDGESEQPFVAGMYLRKGITITSRGCVNNCPFCMVKKNSQNLMISPKETLSKIITSLPVQIGIGG